MVISLNKKNFFFFIPLISLKNLSILFHLFHLKKTFQFYSTYSTKKNLSILFHLFHLKNLSIPIPHLFCLKPFHLKLFQFHSYF
ncbi:hypothetical protein RhiirA5_19992 [Rhizophagus irregularis]|uniref:Uncharacterized protein n=1 Tax=Rhizophagus irregularis TaxID=588596 RepID=A0A2N0P9A1_9GLOM|nr:hypothetical protein RhiirA5_19992 [Rhizophagus irregularis]